MAGFITMIAGKGHILKNHWLPDRYFFGEADLDAMGDFFMDVPQDTCLVIGVRAPLLSSDVEQDFSLLGPMI